MADRAGVTLPATQLKLSHPITNVDGYRVATVLAMQAGYSPSCILITIAPMTSLSLKSRFGLSGWAL